MKNSFQVIGLYNVSHVMRSDSAFYLVSYPPVSQQNDIERWFPVQEVNGE